MKVFAEDLGSKFNAFAREAWRLVLLFILTELKRGFTQCLREKGLLNQALADSQSAAAAASAAATAAANAAAAIPSSSADSETSPATSDAAVDDELDEFQDAGD